MIVRLTLGEMERAGLVLRGGSVLDWRRLKVASREECDTILRVNGFDPKNSDDQVHLNEIRISAIDYLERTFQFVFASEIRNVESISDLMLMAAARNPALRRQACTKTFA